MDLEELRSGINDLDKIIQDAFTQRMELCKQVAVYKTEHHMQVFQTDREKEILKRIRNNAPEGLESPSALLFQTIMDISKYLQYRELHKHTEPYQFKPLELSPIPPYSNGGRCSVESQHVSPEANANHAEAQLSPIPPYTVACQGSAGANSETAAKQIFGNDCQPEFLPTFADVFEAVQCGKVQFGIIPVQNSTAGSVVQAYDLMSEYNFYICSSTVVEITNCLAVRKGTTLSQVKDVYSHPQALSQCSHFIGNHNMTAHEYGNTATAAELVANSNQPIGAICSESCAQLHGLEILETHISDYVPNYTQFFCISKELLLSEKADRISVVLKLPHEEGSLYRLLSKFVIGNMNLLKLESRPIRNGSFEVMFYLDFSGNIHDASVSALLSDLSENLEYFKFLGNYHLI
ncbi:MAG: prephenate dehydratase domain-containing protein [Oscillospiraceae bacterium]